MRYCGFCETLQEEDHFLFAPGTGRQYGCKAAAAAEQIKTTMAVANINALMEHTGHKLVQRGSLIYPVKIRRRRPVAKTKPAKPKRKAKIDPQTPYTMCRHCDHFVEENSDPNEELARHDHLEDGEQNFDHDAEPGEVKTLFVWKKIRPELFEKYPDKRTGPNSLHFPGRRGKTDRQWGDFSRMTLPQVASLAVCVLRPFGDNSSWDDYQAEDGWNTEQYQATIDLLEALADPDKAAPADRERVTAWAVEHLRQTLDKRNLGAEFDELCKQANLVESP